MDVYFLWVRALLARMCRYCSLPALALCAAVFSAPLVAAPAKEAGPFTILVVGDSLSAEYGLPRGTGWVALLEKKLAQEKIEAKVVNASISGETTSGGRSRLPALLSLHKPSVVVVELGGNDALRGMPIAMTQANLIAMAQASQNAKAKVLLVGMQIPPNFGADYSAKFASVFVEVSKAQKTALVPFFLKGVADVPNAADLFQPDRIHPKEQAHPQMLANVWGVLKLMVK